MHRAGKDTREPHESAFSALRRLKGKGAKSARFLKKGGTTNAIRPLSAGQIRDFLFAGAPKHAPRRAAQFGIAAPPGIPAENLMAVRLREDAAPLHGTLVYPAAFGI